jgi:hypothetical protein
MSKKSFQHSCHEAHRIAKNAVRYGLFFTRIECVPGVVSRASTIEELIDGLEELVQNLHDDRQHGFDLVGTDEHGHLVLAIEDEEAAERLQAELEEMDELEGEDD